MGLTIILPFHLGDPFEKKPFFSRRKSEEVELKGRKFLGSLFSQEEPAVSLLGEGQGRHREMGP